jgi:hypothetical protein
MPVIISGAVSGATTLQATDAVTATITLPSATGTVQLANSALNGSLGATTPSTVAATTIDASSTISTTGSHIVLGANTYAGTGVKSINITGQYPSLAMYDGANTNRYAITSSNSGITEYYSAQHKFYNMSGTLNPLLLNAVGGVQTLNTIGVGAATPSASGAGITFPATQSASTDANTLDDYEEGTWTPTVGTNNGTATTFTIGTAYYTKVGRLVNVSGIITPTNGTLGTTNSWVRITGLPFSVVSSSSTGSGINSANYNNGVATLVAYSSTLDAAFVTGCATNNGWSFSATYFTS